ncbi:MAG: hypothetical protein JSV80_13955 [Acidobacteriota bacterium]|nr:MAG: hypothetical protein JSV80_13955 [Acidobacteriota bacterium]
MRHSMRLAVLFVSLLAFDTPATQAQAEPPPHEPGSYIVSLYHAAPGKQLDFLEWMAARAALSKQAGVAPAMWFVHQDGDSWDYLAIAPVTTPEQDKKIEELAKKKNLPTGFAAGLELRQYILKHTDTFSWGPISVEELIQAAKGGN